MEYSESFKIVNEMYTALYKYRNTKAWGPFKIQDIRTKAYEGAKKRWAELKKISRKERLVKVSFYENRFTCVTGDVTQEFTYDEIEGIYETDTTLALVAGKKRKKVPASVPPRKQRMVCLMSEEEVQIVDRYLKKYQIKNKARWLRETILAFIHQNMEDDYPTLFKEHDMRR